MIRPRDTLTCHVNSCAACRKTSPIKHISIFFSSQENIPSQRNRQHISRLDRQGRFTLCWNDRTRNQNKWEAVDQRWRKGTEILQKLPRKKFDLHQQRHLLFVGSLTFSYRKWKCFEIPVESILTLLYPQAFYFSVPLQRVGAKYWTREGSLLFAQINHCVKEIRTVDSNSQSCVQCDQIQLNFNLREQRNLRKSCFCQQAEKSPLGILCLLKNGPGLNFF